MRTTRGFSLIELLVVIAIIGILSGVVMASVNVARDKGRDASIKQDIDSLTAQATLYDDQQGTYGTASNCSSGLFAEPIIARVISTVNTVSGGNAPACFADGASYIVAAVRPSSALYAPDHPYWCADSIGAKCATDALPTAAGTCACAP